MSNDISRFLRHTLFVLLSSSRRLYCCMIAEEVYRARGEGAEQMNDIRKQSLLAVCAVFALVGWQAEALAQAKPKADTPATAGGPVARIRGDMGGLGPRSVVKTPEYSTSVPRGKTSARDWVELSVSFDTEPEWIDELTFQCYALLRDKKKGDYTLFKGSVTYVDVAKGRGHVSTMYLRPSALARYGEVVAIAVEILHNGAVIDHKSDDRMAKGQRLAKEWWSSPNLPVKEGYLLSRAQTPFGLVNIDDYETIK